MIPRLDTSAIDLGRDSNRMSTDNADRQLATVNRILEAFFADESRRREVQLLADEVGMGKTFVALGVGYAILAAMSENGGRESLGLRPSYRVVLVITPGGNHALSEKWQSEAEALITRCSRDAEKTRWFRAKLCKSTDELLQAICQADDRRRKVPVLLIANAGIFSSRLSEAAERFLIGALFRWWAHALPYRERFYVVRALAATPGSAEWADFALHLGRGDYDVQMWDWAGHERYLAASDTERDGWGRRERELFSKVSITYAAIATAFDRFVRDGGWEELENLRLLCRADTLAREPGDRRTVEYREWYGYVAKLKDKIRELHKKLWPYLLDKQLPLVISDEAHHFRHEHRRDCTAFRTMLAPYTQRLLMLTATPLQLVPEELLNVLKTGDAMQNSIGREAVERLQHSREGIGEAMGRALEAGERFASCWGALADQMTQLNDAALQCLSDAERLAAGDDPRTERLACEWARVSLARNGDRQQVLDKVAGPLRTFFESALELRDANRNYEKQLKPLVIRHRRNTEHRRYWIGREYPPVTSVVLRPDQNRLHLAPGSPIPPDAELAQYLLMRVVADITQGAHRTALGADLTGSYRTLWASEEGRRTLTKNLPKDTEPLLNQLRRITGSKDSDYRHPKLKLVADEVMRRWADGEKSLVFCSRVPTAHALFDVISKRVERELRRARQSLLEQRGTGRTGDGDALQQFRRSLTAREQSGINLFLDRFLFSWLDANGFSLPSLIDADLVAIAGLCARATHLDKTLFTDFKRPDRVFLHRAIEHVLAKRLLAERSVLRSDALSIVADEAWVKFRYGNASLHTEKSDGDSTEYRARTSTSAVFGLRPASDSASEALLLTAMRQRLSRKANILDMLVHGPNLLFPPANMSKGPTYEQCREMRRLLLAMTQTESGWDWATRAQVLDAIIRALLREDMLLRLPTDVFTGDDDTWAERLLRGLHAPGRHQREPIASRIFHFLAELRDMGPGERASHLRYLMRAQTSSVERVTGETKDRGALFNAFNTPLVPDVLVCTQVGGEGIDLHRQCRHLVHYDLNWNPATMEQCTGRVDRIGSKAERERAIAMRDGASGDTLPGLDVALPYLAGTYDERVFDALRTRAQMFEILMGGDVSADPTITMAWLNEDEPIARFVPLPQEMVHDLRVDLSVWRSSAQAVMECEIRT